MIRFFILIGLLILSSCGQDPRSMRTTGGTDNSALTTQNIGRASLPCGCTEQSDPVCSEGGVNYTNACIANCLGVNYSMGVCGGGTVSNCNAASGYVCAQPPMPECPEGTACAQVMPNPRAFVNECVMMQSKASLIHYGLCY